MDKEIEIAQGDCFEVNARICLHQERDWFLCHGIVTNSKDGKPMSHCWIEYDEVVDHGDIKFTLQYVLDVSNGNYYEGTRGMYYLAGRINPDNVVKYTRLELARKIKEHETYGPWDLVCER